MHPFNPHYLLSGFKGLGLGFPLAIYMLMGWEAGGPMAEETTSRARTSRVLCLPSVALMLASFVLFSYATVEAYGENVGKLTAGLDPVHRRWPRRSLPSSPSSPTSPA